MRRLLPMCLGGILAAGTAAAQPPAERPAATAEATAAPSSEPAAAAASADCPAPESFWLKVPPVRKMPPLGMTVINPTGPGYYSAVECLQGVYREKPPAYPYPRFGLKAFSFFDADFRYLDKPDNQEHDFFDPIKRIHCGDDWLFSTGGDIRYRYNNEQDSRLSGINNDYGLFRTRVYTDLWYRDCVRVYAEFLYADSSSQSLPPLPTDIDRGDFLNLFADIKLMEIDEEGVYFRVGRQELLYGSQRLISPLEWANTRRTFQGFRGFYTSKKGNVDLFCVQPVPPSATEFNSGDNNQVFSGLWTTWFPAEQRIIDFYYLNLDNTNQVAVGQDGEVGGFNVSTFGGRYYGNHNNWLLDAEGMLQFGPFSNQETWAQAFSLGGGYYFKDLPMTPQWWVYYDFASGDPNPGAGDQHRTFNQLFPFGHYYLGYLDLVGRQNIRDLNTQICLFPTHWITTLMQVHIFRLDEARDALYAANGKPIRQDKSGLAGTDVGQELDFLVNFHLNHHSDLLISYSYLFAGDFIKETGSPRSPSALYVQYEYRW